MARELIFVSSVQKELTDERRALAAFVRGHPLLQRFFDVFLFEELPATDRRAGDLYLENGGTRHKPDKPDARRDGRETRQKPDKPDTTDRAPQRRLEERTRKPHRKGATKGPNGPSRPAPGRMPRPAGPAASRQKPAKPAMGSSPHVPRRAKRPEPRPKWLAKGSMSSSLRRRRKRDKNGTNGT